MNKVVYKMCGYISRRWRKQQISLKSRRKNRQTDKQTDRQAGREADKINSNLPWRIRWWTLPRKLPSMAPQCPQAPSCLSVSTSTTRIHFITRYVSYFIFSFWKIRNKFILFYKKWPHRPQNKSVPTMPNGLSFQRQVRKECAASTGVYMSS